MKNPEEESLLNHVLDSWAGNCLGFTTLYLILGDALKLPVVPILAPGHIFVRYDNGSFKRNIETTAMGSNLSEEKMAKQLRITLTPEHRMLGTYFHVISSIYANAGLLLARQGNIEEALRFFDNAQKLNTKSGEAHIDRALVLITTKHFQEALKESEIALELYPEATQAYLNEGVCLKGLKRPDEAIQAYKKAIRIKPSFSPAYYNLANLYDELGKTNDAIFNYSKAIELNPSYAKAYYNRAALYLEEKNTPQKALSDLNASLKLDDSNHEVYFVRGLTYQALNNFTAAKLDFTKYMEIEPQSAMQKNVKAIIEKMNEQTQK